MGPGGGARCSEASLAWKSHSSQDAERPGQGAKNPREASLSTSAFCLTAERRKPRMPVLFSACYFPGSGSNHPGTVHSAPWPRHGHGRDRGGRAASGPLKAAGNDAVRGRSRKQQSAITPAVKSPALLRAAGNLISQLPASLLRSQSCCRGAESFHGVSGE